MEYFENRDGWWNKYIKNTGLVEYQTLNHRPHWQCTKCDFNDADIGMVRKHVFTNHSNPIRKETIGGFYAIDDSMGG